MHDDITAAQLYLISPPAIEDLSAFAKSLEAALSVGVVGAFQLRLKDLSVSLASDQLTYPALKQSVFVEVARVLMPICHAHEVAFIVNDSPEIAAACDADGVHLGQEDASIDVARDVLGDQAVIGVSCHDSRHLAMVAGEQGADYVAFGAFFPTRSKTPQALAKWGTPDPELVDWWTVHTTVPCVAIGGITPDNCSPVLDAGVDFLAVLSYVWDHPDGAKAAVEAFARKLSPPN